MVVLAIAAILKAAYQPQSPDQRTDAIFP